MFLNIKKLENFQNVKSFFFKESLKVSTNLPEIEILKIEPDFDYNPIYYICSKRDNMSMTYKIRFFHL